LVLLSVNPYWVIFSCSMKLEESSLRVAYQMIIIEFEIYCMNSMPSFECALLPHSVVHYSAAT